MRPRAIRLLERLAEHQLEELRRDLAATEARRAELARAMAAERGGRAREVEIALGFDGGTRLAGAYWHGSRLRETAIQADAGILRARSEELMERLVDALGTARRYELHADALERREAVRLERREQVAIEDVGRLRRRADAAPD